MSANYASMTSLDAPDDVLEQGYDENFDPAAPDAYECPICLLVLRKPMQTECGHRFCRGCILKVVREGRPNCPIDNETLNESQIYPDNFARREILGLSVHCYNHKNHGCPWHKALKDLPRHIEECEFSMVQCPNNCNIEVLRSKLRHHQDNECIRRIITCKHCDLKVIFQRQNEHNERCTRFPVTCPNDCNTSLVREQLNKHLEAECPKLVLKCQYREAGCNFEGPRDELEKHMNDVSNNHMQSLLEIVRKLLHRVDDYESLVEKLSEREEKMDISTPPSEITVLSPSSTSPSSVSWDNRDSKIQLAENNKLSKQLKELEIKVSQCTTVTEMCRSEIKQGRIETEGKFEQLQQTISEQANLISEINARVWCGKFIWRITGFDALFKQARNGDLPAIHSQPFYTGVPGYKMCLRVNLNGIDSGAHTHVSMFVHLMQGEFDSIIDWPFPGGLTLTIMDQDPRAEPQHVKETLYARPTLQAFIRPKTPRNHKGYGYVEMIPHNTLRTLGYLKNDTMIVKVEVKMPQR